MHTKTALMDERLIAVTITGPSATELSDLCHTVVTERLAACANITPIRSLYWWDGAVQDQPEALAVLHTVDSAFQRLTERVHELHPYDVPQVVALPLTAAQDYGTWIVRETTMSSARHSPEPSSQAEPGENP